LKKQSKVDTNDDETETETNTIQVLKLDNIFNFDKEQACYEGQTIDPQGKIPYERWPPIEEVRWNNFKAKCIDHKTGKWYTIGDNGICQGKEGPKRYVNTIIRMKARDSSEYLLSNSKIIAYDAQGDIQKTTANLSEKYTKTTFRFETVPNHEIGYSERRNMGPSENEIIYTQPFTKENAQKLFDLRENDQIQFIVKEQDGKVDDVKPQITVKDTFKLFTESSFTYLFNANYISKEQKEFYMRLAEGEGLIPTQTDDERTASILAQEALSDKQKMASYQ
jgi:hypothetical protein